MILAWGGRKGGVQPARESAGVGPGHGSCYFSAHLALVAATTSANVGPSVSADGPLSSIPGHAGTGVTRL